MNPNLLSLMQYNPQAAARPQVRNPAQILSALYGQAASPLQQLNRGQITPAAALAALGGGGGLATRPAFVNKATPGGASPAQLAEMARGADVIYGFDSGSTIANNATATLTVAPQKRHIPKRIALSSTLGTGFAMSDFRVGVEPILGTVGNINMAVFIQDSTAPNFRAVVCEVGMDVSITVTNISGGALRFTATVVGAYLPA